MAVKFYFLSKIQKSSSKQSKFNLISIFLKFSVTSRRFLHQNGPGIDIHLVSRQIWVFLFLWKRIFNVAVPFKMATKVQSFGHCISMYLIMISVWTPPSTCETATTYPAGSRPNRTPSIWSLKPNSGLRKTFSHLTQQTLKVQRNLSDPIPSPMSA